MSDVKTLHDEDFLAWSKDQAQALRTGARAGSNQKLDWENLAEEIEGLGISQRHALNSQIERIIRHLLKLEHSPAAEPRRRWEESIDDARSEIELLLAESPSLAGEIPAAIAAGCNRGSRTAIRDLEKYDELDATTAARIRAATYSAAQILGDWFPPEPQG
jgi:hypothetical protein